MRLAKKERTELTPEQRAERKRKHRNRRIVVYGSLVALFLGFYAWQPWELDLIPRKLPENQAKVDPDATKLFSKGTKILLITAHPDDSEFYIGGTLARLAPTASIHQIICTDGDKGYYPFEDHERNRKVRQQEARDALKAWNGAGISFLGFPDGRMTASQSLVDQIAKQIEDLKPDYVFAFDGDYPPRFSHRDHRRAGDASILAAKQAGFKGWLMLFSTLAPNYIVDVSDLWDQREKLLAIHKSQFFGERLEGVSNMVAGRAEEDGEMIGVTYGEGFRCIVPGQIEKPR